jgi:hypothetical protein
MFWVCNGRNKDDVVIQRRHLAIADTHAPGIATLSSVPLHLDLDLNRSQINIVRHRQGARPLASSRLCRPCLVDFFSMGRIVDPL